MFSASIAAAAIAGGNAVENTYDRARFSSQSIKLLPTRDKSAGAAQRLAQRAHADVNAAFDSQMFGNAAAMFAEHAGGVCFVHHQHGGMFFGQLGQLRQRRQIAVHAEERIGDDQSSAIARRILQQFGQMIDIQMAIHMHLGPREPATVDQAGMIFRIGINRIAAIHQRRNRTEIRGKPGGEQQRRFGAFEFRQATLQFGMSGGVACHQRTGPGAQTFCRSCLRGSRGSQSRIGGQP